MVPGLMHIAEEELVRGHSARELKEFKSGNAQFEFDAAKRNHDCLRAGTTLSHEADRGILQARLKIQILGCHVSIFSGCYEVGERRR